MKKFKKILLLSITIILLIPSISLAVLSDEEIKEKIKPPNYQDEKIIELLKPEELEKTKEDKAIVPIQDKNPEIKGEDKSYKTLPQTKSKPITSNIPVQTPKPVEEQVKEESNEPIIEENLEDKQFISFKSENGRLYYLVKTKDKDGNVSTDLYSEMNDDKLQSLSSGKSQDEINREKKLKAEQEALEKEKAELEILKNQKPEPTKKKSNSGLIFMVIVAIGAVVSFKRFKENKVDNSDDYIDDDYAYYDEEYDNEYDSDDYPETEGYELNHNDELEFEGDEE